MDVDKVFLMFPEFREVNNYNMYAAWNDFYKENPDIGKAIETEIWESYKEFYTTLKKENPEAAESWELTEEFKNKYFKAKGQKKYDYVVGTLDKFKEWFSKNKNNYFVSKEIKKVNYKLNEENPSELTAQNLNRAQRNNLIIDIAFGILTHKSTAEKILNPGNFNTLKLMSRVASITGDTRMMEEFIKKYNLSDRKAAGRKLLELIKTRNLEVLDNFVKNYSEERNPLSPLTFAYYHQQNMVGAALIGMYANNTTAQAKFQQATGFSIKSDFGFVINGRSINSLSEAYTTIAGIQERISKMCAQWSASSVDNVKDPVLAMLLQNTRTANITGTLIRAGVSIDEVSMLFRQPVVVDLITDNGELKEDDIKDAIRNIYSRIAELNGTLISGKDIIRGLKANGVTSDGLMESMVIGEDINTTENLDFLNNQLKVLYLFKDLILPVVQDMSELTKISRADSPNAAIASSLSEAKVQIARVNRFLSRRTGDDKFALKGLDRVLDAKVNVDMPISELRDIFFRSKMPMLQAFYSLGIELGTHLLKNYFPQMGDNVSNIVDTILYDVSDYWGFGLNDNLKYVYRDLTTFVLTKTKLFGNDGSNTFWDKYTYYMYEYPKHFLEAINSNPEVATLPIIKKMEVRDGAIILNRAGRLDRTVREMYMRSLDSLLYMDGDITMTIDGKKQSYPIQKLAVDLFMYAFYADGHGFGPNSYSMFLSTQYLTAFPEYIEALRDMDKTLGNSETSSNAIEQFWANRGMRAAVVVKDNSEDHSEVQELEDGTIAIKPDKVVNRNKNNGTPYTYIRYGKGLYRIKNLGSSLHVYEQFPTLNNGKGFTFLYNANQTISELSETKVDPKIIENSREYIPTSQEEEMQSLLDNITYFNDINSISEETRNVPNFDIEDITSNEDLQSEYLRYSNQFRELEQFASLMENNISERSSSVESPDDIKYNIYESNKQLVQPMCIQIN